MMKWKSESKEDLDKLWLKELRRKWPNSTPRTFASGIGVKGNMLEYIYVNYVPKCYPKWHLLLFCNFLRIYTVEDVSHAQWFVAKETYRSIIANMTENLKKLNYITFLRARDLDHVCWTKGTKNFIGIGVIDTFEAFITKDNTSSYWIRHRYISKKKGSKAVFKYELVVHPLTGEILWFDGPYFGRDHDNSIVKKSGVLDEVKYLDETSCESIVLFGDLGYKGNIEIKTKNDVNFFERKVLNRHRNSVERIIRFIRRFEFLNHSFRHDKDKHAILTEIVVQLCQLDIIKNKTFHLKDGSY